jgi:cbb3-type cytochrome oxidase maturation protein
MESLYFLVPCALIFFAVAIKFLFWAINNGQYDNLDSEGHRILFDAEKKPVDQQTSSLKGSEISADRVPPAPDKSAQPK